MSDFYFNIAFFAAQLVEKLPAKKNTSLQISDFQVFYTVTVHTMTETIISIFILYKLYIKDHQILSGLSIFSYLSSIDINNEAI